MKKNIPEVGFTGVLDLVSVLANAGYRPQDFDSFADCTIQASYIYLYVWCS